VLQDTARTSRCRKLMTNCCSVLFVSGLRPDVLLVQPPEERIQRLDVRVH